MQQHPDITQLLQVVTDFLRAEIMPDLDGARSFHVRVAANALDIVRRELETDYLVVLDKLHRRRDQAAAGAGRQRALLRSPPRMGAHRFRE
jgi:hypothetical protein